MPVAHRLSDDFLWEVGFGMRESLFPLTRHSADPMEIAYYGIGFMDFEKHGGH